MTGTPRALRHSRDCSGLVALEPVDHQPAYSLHCAMCGDIGYISKREAIKRELVPRWIGPPITERCPAGKHDYEQSRWQSLGGKDYCDVCKAECEQKKEPTGAALGKGRSG